jgi:hypothetical protein
MNDAPKTPKRSSSNRTAPTILTPSRLGAVTPKTTSKDQNDPRVITRKPNRSQTHQKQQKENVVSHNVDIKCKSDGGKTIPPRSSNHSVDETHYLRAKTSRDLAEIIAVLKTAPSMKVIEVEPGIEISEQGFVDLVKLKVPVIFRGYASDWSCVKNWSKPGYLKRAAVTESEYLPHRKYRQFIAQSAEKGRLHLTDGKSKAKAVSLLDFLQSTEKDTSTNGMYLLGIHAVGGNSSLSYCPVQHHRDDKDQAPPLSKDVPQQIDLLEWYSSFLARENGQSKPIGYDHQQFFLARGYAFTDLHYDSYDNFYVAVTGMRRWTLACPNASRWLISPSSGKLKSGSNAIPHLKDFPPGSPAQIFPFAYIDLLPSDVLFVPNCWWHLVESCPGDDGFSSAFNFFFSKDPEKVFSEFQAGLARTEEIVNSVQQECRENLACSSEKDRSIRDVDHHKIAPGMVTQVVWDSLERVASVQRVGDIVLRLYDQHSSNSIEKWPIQDVKSGYNCEDLEREIPDKTESKRSNVLLKSPGARNKKKN